MRKVLFIGGLSLLFFFPAFARERPILFPEPQSVRYGQGVLPLQSLTIPASPAAGKDVAFALNELRQLIREQTGAAAKTRAGSATFRYTVKQKGRELPLPNEPTGTAAREQYSLRITPAAVEVVATTSTGLYYAVQTLRQLVRGRGSRAALPVVTIEDRPALAYRGVMMDFAHGGLPTVEEIRRQIDFLARWKANQYYFYNEVSIELEGYPTLNYNAGYSQAQVRSIIAYAKERHMDVIPFVNFYGHLHELMRNEKYASLGIGRYGHELDPRKPEVAALLKDWIGQYTALFPSPFIHVGFDETWETKRIARDEEPGIDPQELFIRQLTFVHGEFSRVGKTVMAWTDMTNFYPQMLSKFPPEVIPVIWEYSPDTAAIRHYLDPVLNEKRPFFIQPAVSGWGHIYPSADYTYANIDLCLKAGMKHKTLGFITSVWTDSVEPFVRASWLFMAYGCIGAWQGRAPDKTTFSAAYADLLYPTASAEMAGAFTALALAGQELEKCLGRNTQSLPRGTIVESWSNPFSPYYLTNTNDHRDDFSRSRQRSEEAAEHLILALRKAPEHDRPFIRSLLVSARLVNYTATRFLWAKTVADRWNEAMLVRKKDDYVIYDLTYSCHGLLVDTMDEVGELKAAYSAAWLSENLPYRLNTMLSRFDTEAGLWRKLYLRVLDHRIQKKPDPSDLTFEALFKPDY